MPSKTLWGRPLVQTQAGPWFKPFVMTVGVVIGKNGKFGRTVWDVQPVPGHSPRFRASFCL